MLESYSGLASDMRRILGMPYEASAVCSPFEEEDLLDAGLLVKNAANGSCV